MVSVGGKQDRGHKTPPRLKANERPRAPTLAPARIVHFSPLTLPGFWFGVVMGAWGFFTLETLIVKWKTFSDFVLWISP